MKLKKDGFSIYSPSRSTRSESNYQVLEKMTLDQSFESEKTLFILIQNLKIPIKIDKSEEENLTIGWLLSEVIRKITELKEKDTNKSINWKIFDPKKLMFLECKEKILGINYLLSSCYEEKVSYIRDGTIIIPRFLGNEFDIKNKIL